MIKHVLFGSRSEHWNEYQALGMFRRIAFDLIPSRNEGNDLETLWAHTWQESVALSLMIAHPFILYSIFLCVN